MNATSTTVRASDVLSVVSVRSVRSSDRLGAFHVRSASDYRESLRQGYDARARPACQIDLSFFGSR